MLLQNAIVVLQIEKLLKEVPVGLWPYIILFSNYSGREKEEQKNIFLFLLDSYITK
jgi:hypothetical protein